MYDLRSHTGRPLRVLDRQRVGLADETACRVFKVLLVIEKLRFDFVNSYYEQVSRIIRTFKGFIVNTWATQIGVGLHTGHMMVGVVGDVDRMQGDAISDHLNLGSWLEGLTKFYDAPIVISSATHQK